MTTIEIVTSEPERTWVWSDLHLSDRGVLEAFRQPRFPDTARMNAHLIREWHRKVQVGDTIICLGDIGHPDAWEDTALVGKIRQCPGKRVLVRGDQDTNHEALRNAGFTRQCKFAVCTTEPRLALSHEPLRRLAPGAVNVHGHLKEGNEPSARHINVAVERIAYSPARLSDVLIRARERLATTVNRAKPEAGDRP